EAALSARTNAVFLGASLQSGTAKVLVVETGLRTAFGAIAARSTVEAASPRRILGAHCDAAPEGFYVRAFRRFVTSSTVEYATRLTGRLPGLVLHPQEGQPL